MREEEATEEADLVEEGQLPFLECAEFEVIVAKQGLDNSHLDLMIIAGDRVSDPYAGNENLVQHLEQGGHLDVNYQEMRQLRIGNLHFGSVEEACGEEHDREEEWHFKHAGKGGRLHQL